MVRASMHVDNGDDDLDALVGAVARPAPRRPRALPERVDVLVVGAGIHGSSAAWRLAARGAEVLHLERSRPAHGEGSSHGPTRIIRRAYTSPVWDGLVDRAYAGWADLERESGRTLLTPTGGVHAHPVGTEGLRGPGCVAVDRARAAEIAPGLVLGPEFVAVHDPAAGVLHAEDALVTLAELGRRYGVQRRDETPVLGWEPDGDGVLVRTPDGDVRAERLVLCAGPWTGDLVPGFAGLLNVVRIVNVHVGSSDPAALAPPSLGVFSVDIPDIGLMYGIPAIGGHAVKVGLDHGPVDDPALPPGPVTSEEREVLRALAVRFLPAADGPVVEDIACRYTMAPRNRFAVGPLPGTPQVLVAAACSGHGFKFGPAIGEALADLAHGVARPDLNFLDPAIMLGAR